MHFNIVCVLATVAGGILGLYAILSGELIKRENRFEQIIKHYLKL